MMGRYGSFGGMGRRSGLAMVGAMLTFWGLMIVATVVLAVLLAGGLR